MFANRLHIFLSFALVAALGVSAQVPNLDSCIVGCLTQAEANSTCTSFTDLNCVCGSSSFQSTAAACLQANCTAADQQTANGLKSQCSSLPSGTGTSANATSNAASPTSSKSSAVPILVEQLPFLTAVIVIGGVALGGAFAL